MLVDQLSIKGDSITTILAYHDKDVVEVVQDFMRRIAQRGFAVIGLDTEWTLDDDDDDEEEEAEKNHQNLDKQRPKSRTATVQLCDGEQCLIVQLNKRFDSFPTSLFNFLRLPEVMFVGIGIKENIAKLEKEYGVGCKNAVELGATLGASELSRQIKRLKLVKPNSVVLSDWGVAKLSNKKIKCAAVNAYMYWKIGNKLVSECGENDTD